MTSLIEFGELGWKECAFCSIAHGGSPARIVCESATWLAFLPLEPATPGHTLVVPREHVQDFWRASRVLVAELAVGAHRVGRAIGLALNPEGLNLITSSGSAAEQTVFHAHLHLVPRWHDDGFDPIWRPGEHIPIRDLDHIADRIRGACETT
jgi:histidine triad (HIT) family protein